jgi:hypothetical protein
MRKRLSVPCCLALALAMFAGTASAQTWSERRQRPALFEIVLVDETTHTQWLWGREDIANDGETTVVADEAATDLRSIYANARAGTLWLRTYVAATSAPAMPTVAFFFIDTDASANTGGAAEGAALWPAFTPDPSPGGYERAVGVRGDGTLLGVYFWTAASRQWTKQPDRPVLAEVETGVARDPLRLAGDDHGYLQVALDLPAFDLDEACDGTIFVRLWNDGTGARSFGDSAGPAECIAGLDASGRPEILVSETCTADSSCPARGRCDDGRCVFDYECTQNSECREGQRCSGGMCTGGAAGSGGRSGSSAGGAGGSRGSAGDDGDDGDEAIDGERVRGGAFTCSALAPGRDPLAGLAWLASLALAAVLRRACRRGDR